MPSSKTRPITRADIEAKLGEIRHSADAGADAARGAGTAIGIGAVVLALAVAYVLGRRKGRKRSTIVEVRRL